MHPDSQQLWQQRRLGVVYCLSASRSTTSDKGWKRFPGSVARPGDVNVRLMLPVCCLLESNLRVQHDRRNEKLRKNGGNSHLKVLSDLALRVSLLVVCTRDSFHFYSPETYTMRFWRKPMVFRRNTTQSLHLINKLQSFIQENNRKKKQVQLHLTAEHYYVV
jgi:hypothetical protein